MKTFEVSVYYTGINTYIVEAESEDDARETAGDLFYMEDLGQAKITDIHIDKELGP